MVDLAFNDVAGQRTAFHRDEQAAALEFTEGSGAEAPVDPGAPHAPEAPSTYRG